MKTITNKIFGAILLCFSSVALMAQTAPNIPTSVYSVPNNETTNTVISQGDYADGRHYIVYDANYVRNTLKPTWWTFAGSSGSTSNTLSSLPSTDNTGFSLGSTTAVGIQSGRVHSFRFTNCTNFSILFASDNSVAKTMSLTVRECVSGALSTLVDSVIYTGATAKAVGVISSVNNLDASKEYVAYLVGGTTSNAPLHQIRFVAPALGPTLSLTTGSATATVVGDLPMDSIVYKWTNSTDDAAFTWDAASPAGVNVTTDAVAKTITISGTPANVAVETTFPYTISLTGATSLTGSITVEPYAVPAPIITPPANASQYLKANTAISAMSFTFTNAIDAAVTGLPTGVSFLYDALNSTLSISGVIDATVAPGVYTYVVTTVPLSGYSGNPVTYEATFNVVSATAADVLLLVNSSLVKVGDRFINYFVSNTNYFVTQRDALANFSGNYSDFELIVLHESLTGSNAATATHELSLIKSVDKPILNTKSYFYTETGTSPRWGWGTPANGDTRRVVDVVATDHPIFVGLTLSAGQLELYTSDSVKNIQPTTISIGGYELATVGTGNVAIHELPASIRIGGASTSKYLLISFFNDAMPKLTNDAISLIDNACAYLLGSDVYVPNSGPGTSVSNVASDVLFFDGTTICNPQGATIQLYDAAGRLIQTATTNISMERMTKGVYVVRVANTNQFMKVIK